MRISDWSSDVCSSDLQWAHFTIALGDIDPPHWTRAVTAFRHALDQTVEPRQRHAVEGLSVHSRRHRTPITGYSVIGPLISPAGPPEAVETIAPLTRPRQDPQLLDPSPDSSGQHHHDRKHVRT